MNDLTKKQLITYSIPAAIGFVFMVVVFICTGNLVSSGIIATLLAGVVGALYFIGWYQCIIVDRMKFGSASAFRNPVIGIIYIFLLLFIYWIVGDVKALYLILKTTKK